MTDVKTPVPSGKYKTGTTVFSLWDRTRKERLGPEAGKRDRRIQVRLYYPVLPGDAEGYPEAVAMSKRKLKAILKTSNVPVSVKEDVTARFYQDAPAVPGMKFPLIIYSHGLGAYTEANNFLCIELSSQGYVIAAVGHPYESAINEYEDGTEDLFDKTCMKRVYEPFWSGAVSLLKVQRNRKGTWEEQYRRFNEFQLKYCGFLRELVEERGKDVSFLVKELKERYSDRIDFDAGIGITGHSLGGVTAYHVCQHDDGFICGINIDGLMAGNFEGLVMHKPFCLISCEENTSLETRAVIDTEAPAYWEVFRNMKHHGFCDMKFFIPLKSVVGKMDPLVMHDYLSRIHQGFFDKYLKHIDNDSFLIDDGNVIRSDMR